MGRLMKLLAAAVTAALLWAPSQAAFADTAITAANESDDSEIESGDVEGTNSSSGFVGHQGGDGETETEAQDIETEQSVNVQEGDNEVDAEQDVDTRSGDAVGGQVIGGVSSGDMSIDAANRSEDVDVESGDAEAFNTFAATVGLIAATPPLLDAADIVNGLGVNVQEGDNEADITQSADSSSGDTVGGQIIGAVASGDTDIVLANTSEDVDATSGDSDQTSDATFFTGLAAAGFIEI